MHIKASGLLVSAAAAVAASSLFTLEALGQEAQRTTQAGEVRIAARVGPERVVDRVRALFPKTADWFRIVGTLQMERAPDGRVRPVYSSLTHPRVRAADGAGHSVEPRFGATFGEAMRVSSAQDARIFVDVRPLGVRDVRASIEDGLVVYPDAYADTDVLYKATPTHTDEYLLLRSRRAPTRWRFRVARGPGVYALRQAGNSIEARDAQGASWLRAARPFAIDTTGKLVEGTIRLVGDVIVLEVDTRSLTLPVLVDPDWSSTGDMAYGRFYHGFNVLSDGRVLATGGCSASVCSGDLTIPACRTVVRSAEALSVTTRTFSTVAEDPNARFLHVSESLPNGDVFVAGGCETPDCSGTVSSAAIFSVADGQFHNAGDLGEARAGILSTVLGDGRVLLAGGCTTGGCTARTEAYDPGTSALSALAPMISGRARGRAAVAVLRDGRVLIAGGCASIGCDSVVGYADVYDPVRDRWEAVASMATARGGHYAAVLTDGRVVVGGGCSQQDCGEVLSSSEIFDPATMTFSAGPDMTRPRVGALAAVLPNGSVMVSQGCSARAECDLTNEIYYPTSGAFHAVEPAVTPRGFHAVAVHRDANLFIANGGCQPGTCSWWVESYDISALGPPDAGPAGPDAGRRDAGTSSDAGTLSRKPPKGCGCSVWAKRNAASTPLGIGLLAGLCVLRALRTRPRRRHRTSSSRL